MPARTTPTTTTFGVPYQAFVYGKPVQEGKPISRLLLQIHANICMRAVVVTETLDWRLHGLDLMTEHMATGDLPLMSASWMVGAQYKPSEIAKCEWSVIQQGPPWAVDSWGLGCLMQVTYFLLSQSQSQIQACALGLGSKSPGQL